MVHSADSDIEIFQGDTLAPFLFITCLEYIQQTPINLTEKNGFSFKKKKKKKKKGKKQIVSSRNYY